jgi:hypothetical protein
VAPPCAGLAQGGPVAEQGNPAAGQDTKPGNAEAPASAAKPGNTGAPASAAAPCGATAAAPGVMPGQPVVVPEAPAIPPCAQSVPRSCGCLNSENAPAAPAAEPALPAAPALPETPVVPGQSGVAPCAAAEDKPMAVGGKAAEERPAAPSCGDGQHAPAAVQQEPASPPDAVAPMTPLKSPGKSAHAPHGHHPLGSGRAHRDCARQGTGFVCPLGPAPRHRPHVLNLTAPAHPHAVHCVGAGAGGTACHTREARPLAAPQPVTGQRLPTTGGSTALLALSGLGLAGAGVVLYRISRTRRGQE